METLQNFRQIFLPFNRPNDFTVQSRVFEGEFGDGRKSQIFHQKSTKRNFLIVGFRLVAQPDICVYLHEKNKPDDEAVIPV